MAADRVSLRLSAMRGTMLLEAEGRPCTHDVSDREQHQGLLDRKRHGVVRPPLRPVPVLDQSALSYTYSPIHLRRSL